MSQTVVTVDVVEQVLVETLNNLEPQLMRQDYNLKTRSQLLQVKPGEVGSFLNSQLPKTQTQEFMDKILQAGIPLSS